MSRIHVDSGGGREEYFSQFPQPPELAPEDQARGRLTAKVNDEYLTQLEGYIEDLGSFIRSIQSQEGTLYAEFRRRLELLKGQDPTARSREEKEEVAAFEESLKTIRARRTNYRRMLADALTQRSHLLDSMILHKQQDDLVRAQLYQMRALPDHESPEKGKTRFSPFSILLAADQAIMLLVFALAVSFPNNALLGNVSPVDAAQTPYSFYTDIALLVLVGLGFLLTFLAKYAYSSLGFTLMLTAFTLQWTILVTGFFTQAAAGVYTFIPLTFRTLLDGMYGVVAVLISFGAVAGTLSPLAMLVMAFWEVVVYGINLYVGAMLLQADDYGYSFFVHVFGATFGLACSVFASRHYTREGARSFDEASDYTSDTFAMLGTLVLWVFFPSLNAALAPASAQARVALNTVLALAGGTTFAFVVSRLFHQKKFRMADIQNATIGAGVAISSSAAVVVTPGIGLLMGILGSSLAVVVLTFLRPWLVSPRSLVKIHDTRGVLAVHGLPGFLAAIAGIIATAIAASEPNVFGVPFDVVFRRGSTQAGYQAAALVITLLLALAGGLLVGLLIMLLDRRAEPLWFSDEQQWLLPSDFAGVTKMPPTMSHVVRQ